MFKPDYCVLVIGLFVCISKSLSPKPVTFESDRIKINGTDFSMADINWVDLVGAVYRECDHVTACPTLVDRDSFPSRIESCCIPCQCSAECDVRGTCCRNSSITELGVNTNKKIATEAGETCELPPLVIRENNTQAMFMMVARCPDDYNGLDKCTNRSSTTWNDVSPVTNNLTDITYLNRHCAYCNNQSNDLDPWMPLLTCERFIPPNVLVSSKSANVHGLINTYGCKVNWISSKYAKMCYKTDPLYICQNKDYLEYCRVIPRNGLYVHNFIMNIFNANCLDLDLSVVEFPGFQVPITAVSFAAMLRFDADREEITQSPLKSQINSISKLVCPSRKVGCFKRVCSPSQATSQGGICVDVIQSILGLCFDFRVKVVLNPASKWINASVASILQETERYLVLSSDGLGKMVYSELTTVAAKGVDIIYHIRVLAKSSSAVNVRDVFFGYESRLKQQSKTESFLIELDNDNHAFKPMPLEEVNFVSYSNGLGVFDCGNEVAMHKIQFCDSVLISADEFIMTENNVVVLANEQQLQQHEYIIRTTELGDENVQICVEDLRMESGCAKFSLPGLLCIFLLIIFCSLL